MITNNSRMLDIMAKSLDAYTLRNETISQNIANDDTPLYKRKDVKFEELLTEELASLDSSNANRIGNRSNKKYIANQNPNYKNSLNGINGIVPEVFTQESGSKYRIDGNNVDIDNEMSELVKNQIRYSVVLSQVNKQFTAMRTAMGK